MTLEDQATTLSHEEIVSLLAFQKEFESELHKFQSKIQSREELITRQKQRIAWLEKELFGRKSEKRLHENDPRQLYLGELIDLQAAIPLETETVKGYQRQAGSKAKEECFDESGLQFGDNVPVETMEIPNPAVEGLVEGVDYKVISEKVTHRLAQRPASYVVLKYVRKVVKLKEDQKLICPSAPPAVIEKSYADVSFLAGLLVQALTEAHGASFRSFREENNVMETLGRGTYI